ncbi:DoxX family membrane protein [Flavobacteriaceae bacterium]|nr:DoxX family membrane protein [Flavobacteriaceae bacterium]
MKTNALNFGLLFLRLGISIGMLTHGYGKFMKILAGDFSFGDPIGIGPTASLILCTIAEFIAPLFLIAGWKTRWFALLAALNMLVNAFKEWLLTEKEYSLNNAGLQLKLLKMICKEAERMSINVNPYTRHIESFTQKSKDRVLQTISFEEIKKIKAIRDLPSTLENARKWILIGLYIGQRVSDLLNLKPSQLRFIESGVYIDINQQKTDKYVTVGVVDKEVIKVLKYKFPYSISAQLFNRQIKQICQIAGIYEIVCGYKLCIKTRRKRLGTHPKYSLISSHDLRRSFATNYFGKIETPILMQITGHSKESTFLSYIASQVNKDTYADAFMKVAATL